MASCSSSTTAQEKYDVFLSFRGEDTRDNFTSHLHAFLCRKKVKTFIDIELRRGDDISDALWKTIKNSLISVVIFSKDYASSSWCMDELVKILECKKMYGQMVIPVFYNIDPSHVRKQTGSFADAFTEHTADKEKIHKVQSWKDALTEVADLSGWASQDIRPESVLVDEIGRDILKKLNDNYKSSIDSEGLIGINSCIETIKSLLHIGLLDFRTVGIWGMGGIGKTTIAEAVFNQISWEFEGCHFLADIRKESEKRGLVCLRKELFSKLLESESIDISTLTIGPTFVRNMLRQKKVLIVLDDVNNSRQLEIIPEGIKQFGPGSRIIITTRDKQVLNNFGVDELYKVEGLNADNALQLFCQHAFKHNQSREDRVGLSKRVVDYAKGLPLALKTLGSFLNGRSKQEWQSALNKLERIPDNEIQQVLRISYDGLDDEQKDIFLDIACFFVGKNREYVERILSGCGFSVDIGISVLIDKSLITISSDKLGMHELLEDMGLEIVRQESIKEPGKRSRLCILEDVHHVLTKNTGTQKVEGIFLDLSKIENMQLSSQAFKRMYNLRMLIICGYVPSDKRGVYIPRGLEYLSDKLSYLCWDCYPLKYLPSNFNPENLVELSLCNSSRLKQLWNGVPNLVKLKHIYLTNCNHLSGISELSRATNLEHINLVGCTSLLELPSFIRCFHKLISLDLSRCKNLKKFPDIPRGIKFLYLKATGIEKVPSSSIMYLSNLELLDLEDCRRLKNLASNVSNLTSLKTLQLSGCSNITRFPQVPGRITNLCLSGTAIEELPSSSTGYLSNLRSLRLENCRSLKKFPDVSLSIEYLYLDGTGIEEVPSSVERLCNLRYLNLRNCRRLENLPSNICNLTSLYNLDLFGCFNITKFPEVARSITSLNLGWTAIEQVPSSIEYLSKLEDLHLGNCKRLESLPHSICKLEWLEHIDLSNFSKLDSLPGIFEILKYLMLNGRLRASRLPGSEIPLWFKHQSMASSSSILVIPRQCIINLMGLATCVVFGVGENSTPLDDFRMIWCQITLGPSILHFSYPSIAIKSNHLLLNFLPWEKVRTLFAQQSGSDIKIEFLSCVPWCEVKKCGLRLVYKHDWEEILHGLDESPIEEGAILWGCPTKWGLQRRLRFLSLLATLVLPFRIRSGFRLKFLWLLMTPFILDFIAGYDLEVLTYWGRILRSWCLWLLMTVQTIYSMPYGSRNQVTGRFYDEMEPTEWGRLPKWGLKIKWNPLNGDVPQNCDKVEPTKWGLQRILKFLWEALSWAFITWHAFFSARYDVVIKLTEGGRQEKLYLWDVMKLTEGGFNEKFYLWEFTSSFIYVCMVSYGLCSIVVGRDDEVEPTEW